MWNVGRGKLVGTPLPSLRSRWDSRSTRCGNSRGGGRSVVGRSGGITAHTLAYLRLLLEASAWALISAVVTEICAKFERRGLRGCGQYPSLVLHWSLRTAW